MVLAAETAHYFTGDRILTTLAAMLHDSAMLRSAHQTLCDTGKP